MIVGKLSRQAFAKINIKKILWYMDFLKEKSPQHRPRFSEQTWLRQDKNSDPVLRRLLERWAQSIHLRNGKRAACNHGVMDARGRLLSTKEA